MGKIVLITGAAGNLGKSVTKKFLEQGYKVIAVLAPGGTLGYEVDGDIEIHHADLTNEGSAKEAISAILSKNKRLDAAALLAGGYTYGGIADAPGDVVDKMIKLNFNTAYFVARPVFQHMISQKDGGKIVFIGSKPALNPTEGKNSLAYALSKSMLLKLSDYLNAEGASKNVTTSVVAPSIIDTEPNRKAMPGADFSKWVTAEEVAEVIAFVCSEEGLPLRENVLKVYGKS